MSFFSTKQNSIAESVMAVMKETQNEPIKEGSEHGIEINDKEQFLKFYQECLTRFGIKKSSELTTESMKEQFYSYIKNHYKEEAKKVEEGSKEEYEKFFMDALKKHGVESPADFKSDEEKKKFFDYIKKNYKGKTEDIIPDKYKSEFSEFVEEKFDGRTREGKAFVERINGGRLKRENAKKTQTEDYENGELEDERIVAEKMNHKDLRQSIMDIWNEGAVKYDGRTKSGKAFAEKVSDYSAKLKKEDDDAKEDEENDKKGKTLTGKEKSKIELGDQSKKSQEEEVVDKELLKKLARKNASDPVTASSSRG